MEVVEVVDVAVVVAVVDATLAVAIFRGNVVRVSIELPCGRPLLMSNARSESDGPADGKSTPSTLISSVANIFSTHGSRLLEAALPHSATPSTENPSYVLRSLLRCSIATTFRQLRSAESVAAQLQSPPRSLDAIAVNAGKVAALTSAALAAPLVAHEVVVATTAAARKTVSAQSLFLPPKIVQHWNSLRRSLFVSFCGALRPLLQWLTQQNADAADFDSKAVSGAFEAVADALQCVLAALRANAARSASATKSPPPEINSTPFRVSDAMMVQEQLPHVFEMAVHAFVHTLMGDVNDGATKTVVVGKQSRHSHVLKRLVQVCVPPLLQQRVGECVGFHHGTEWFPQMSWLRAWWVGGAAAAAAASQSAPRFAQLVDVKQLLWASVFENATGGGGGGGGELDAKAVCLAFERYVMESAPVGQPWPPRDREPATIRRRVAEQLRTCEIGNHFSELKQPRDINAAIHSDLRVLANSAAARDIAPVQLAEAPPTAANDSESPGAAEETSRKLQASVGDWLGDWVSVGGGGAASAPNTPASRRHLDRRGSAEQRGAQQWGREAYARSLPETVQSGELAAAAVVGCSCSCSCAVFPDLSVLLVKKTTVFVFELGFSAVMLS